MSSFTIFNTTKITNVELKVLIAFSLNFLSSMIIFSHIFILQYVFLNGNVLKSATLLSATPERHSQNRERRRSATPFYQKERCESGTPFFDKERERSGTLFPLFFLTYSYFFISICLWASLYRVSHRYVNTFGPNFENWKITYVKK